MLEELIESKFKKTTEEEDEEEEDEEMKDSSAAESDDVKAAASSSDSDAKTPANSSDENVIKESDAEMKEDGSKNSTSSKPGSPKAAPKATVTKAKKAEKVKPPPNRTIFVDFLHAESDNKKQNPNTGEISYHGPYSAEHKELLAQRLKKRGDAHKCFKTGPASQNTKPASEFNGQEALELARGHVEQASSGSEFLTVSEKSRWDRYLTVPVEFQAISQAIEIVIAVRSLLNDSSVGSGRQFGARVDADALKKNGHEITSTANGEANGSAANSSSTTGVPDTEDLKTRLLKFHSIRVDYEKRWRGVTEDQLCTHCRIEISNLPAGETSFTNVTARLQEEEDRRARDAAAKRQRYRAVKVRETRLCRECWGKWDKSRKEEAKKREEEEAKKLSAVESKRLLWEVRDDWSFCVIGTWL